MPPHEPLILALETATARASAALLRGSALLGEECAAPGQPAAETLLPCVDTLLTGLGIGIAAVEGFAVSVGPGSFTGLRIGIATAKGLAFGSGCRVAPVSTLAALAHAAGSGAEPVVATLDARRGELYAGAFSDRGASPHAALPEGVYLPEELMGQLPDGCRVVGEGAALCDASLRERLGPGVGFDADLDPRAASVGALGARLLAAGSGVDPEALTPCYLRRAEAEVKRTGFRFEGDSSPS